MKRKTFLKYLKCKTRKVQTVCKVIQKNQLDATIIY